MPVHWSITTHPSLASTQDTLKEMIAREDAREGLVVRALEQSAGHGRHGRKWESVPGNLSFSFLLRPPISATGGTTLSLVTGLVLVRAVQDVFGLPPGQDLLLKWPNDVMLRGRKCAGILLENIGGALVIGVGVNIADAPVEGAACLCDYGCNPASEADDLLSRFLAIFEEAYTVWLERGFSAFRADYLRLTYPAGSLVQVKLPKNTIEGAFCDVDAQGALLIQCKDEDKARKITAGDVFLV